MASKETPHHTHASLAWRHETAGVLREIVRRIQSEDDLNDTVIGYFSFPFTMNLATLMTLTEIKSWTITD